MTNAHVQTFYEELNRNIQDQIRRDQLAEQIMLRSKLVIKYELSLQRTKSQLKEDQFKRKLGQMMKLKTFVNAQDEILSLNILNDPDAVKTIFDQKQKPQMEVDKFLRKEPKTLKQQLDFDSFKLPQPFSRKFSLITQNSPLRCLSRLKSQIDTEETQPLDKPSQYKKQQSEILQKRTSAKELTESYNQYAKQFKIQSNNLVRKVTNEARRRSIQQTYSNQNKNLLTTDSKIYIRIKQKLQTQSGSQSPSRRGTNTSAISMSPIRQKAPVLERRMSQIEDIRSKCNYNIDNFKHENQKTLSRLQEMQQGYHKYNNLSKLIL